MTLQVANRDLEPVIAGQGWDVKERPDGAAVLDLDLGDQRPQQGLAGRPIPAGEDVADASSQCRQSRGVGGGGRVGG